MIQIRQLVFKNNLLPQNNTATLGNCLAVSGKDKVVLPHDPEIPLSRFYLRGMKTCSQENLYENVQRLYS